MNIATILYLANLIFLYSFSGHKTCQVKSCCHDKLVECLMLLLLNNQWHDYGFTKSLTFEDFLIDPPLRTDPYTNVIGCQSWQKSENECINFQQSTGIANREVTLFAHKCKAVVVNTNHP